MDSPDETGTALAEREADHVDVSSLVRLAVDKGVSVEILERLVALQERVSDRAAESAMVNAIAEFQAECPSIRKSKKATIRTRSGISYSYTYASLDDIAQTIRPLLHKHGLSYTWDSTVEGGVMTVTCILRHVEGHSVTATFTAPTDTKADMSGAQRHGAALTYARRQSLVQVLGLTSADDDNDAPGAPDVDTEVISAEQVADIESLIQEVKASKHKFLEWLSVESLGAIPTARHEEAVAALERKRT